MPAVHNIRPISLHFKVRSYLDNSRACPGGWGAGLRHLGLSDRERPRVTAMSHSIGRTQHNGTGNAYIPEMMIFQKLLLEPQPVVTTD